MLYVNSSLCNSWSTDEEERTGQGDDQQRGAAAAEGGRQLGRLHPKGEGARNPLRPQILPHRRRKVLS